MTLKTSKKPILFFADRLPPLIGGMEMHAKYFIEYFTDHSFFPLSTIITKNTIGQDCIIFNENTKICDINKLSYLFNPSIIFFNSGRWIEELEEIRHQFPKAIFIYRTGGNEILKAALLKNYISNHLQRQHYWVKNINNSIDIIITNSSYTEQRLRGVGIATSFIKCIGGVNIQALKEQSIKVKDQLIIFCAARFVPYKNHYLLLRVISKLKSQGKELKLRLAGDGPLLAEAKEQVINQNISDIVEFLGPLDNYEVCKEIANANIYMQLSEDITTEVPGGSYIHSEGMGRSIMEAITAGTYVIAGKSGALPEIVNKERGVLLELNNINNLTKKIAKIIETKPKKLKFTNEYCWLKIFKRYEQIFEDVNENITRYRKI